MSRGGGGRNSLGGKAFLGTKEIGGVSSGSDGGAGYSQRGGGSPSPVARNERSVSPSRSGPPKRSSQIKGG